MKTATQQKLSLRDLKLNGKRVLMRVDFNVPLDSQGNITDATRITAALPSIRYILEKGGSLILMSHLGRPNGKVSKEFSLAPCAKRLSQLLNQTVLMAPDCIGSQTSKMAKDLKPGQILLLENLRFHKAEEHPDEDPSFARSLASLGDIYVNDAFGTAHRAHSSTTFVPQYFQDQAAAGFLMEKEIKFLGNSVLNPVRPFYAIIGGAKISSKIGVIQSLLKQADAIFIGGGMTYSFLKAQGIPIGNSIHEDEFLPIAKEILETCKNQKFKFYLPEDIVITDSLHEGQITNNNEENKKAQVRIINAQDGIPDGFEGVDIGPKTIQKYSTELQNAKTVLWNGPLGVFENPAFAKGTQAIAKELAFLSATTIIGGGDSLAAVQELGITSRITHLSTGGGASLEYIEFGTLPGIEALSNK